MGKATHGDLLTGTPTPADLVPFGGKRAHEAFAFPLGLQRGGYRSSDCPGSIAST
jgi:hypothetical protein